MGRLENVVSKYDDYLDNILPGFGKYDPLDKKYICDNIIRYMLNRCQMIFKWSNLPETIPQRILEIYLQTNGHCAFMRHNGELYVYTGGLGGKPDVYYRPTIYTISNPAQEISINAVIDKDCVVMLNDSYYNGILPLCKRYAYSMTETEVSLYIANINSRIISLISAQDDKTQKSAELYIEDIIKGKISIVGEAKFFEDLKTTQYASGSAHQIITDLIELMQYNKASWYNEIGLNANYNMKRESINASESQLNNDALTPLIDDMLNCRKIYAEKVNKMFNTNISVDINSAWKDNEKELKAEIKSINDGGEFDNESKPFEVD